MPGPTLPNMSLICPALDGDAGLWDDEMNAALTLIDSHNHTAGQGVKVPTAGLNINADLSFAGNGITNLKSLAFAEIVALSAGADIIYVDSTTHELFWRTHSGVNVQLTNGAALNVTAFTGGIGGDYGSVAALVSYDAANEQYLFQGPNTPPRGWSKLASGDLHLFQAGTSESVFVGLKAPDTLAASYTATMPPAPPGALAPVYMDNTGAMSTVAGMTRLARQVITTSGTYPQTAGTRAVLVRMVGGGGGGGGAATGTGGACGGGGGGGEYWEKWIASAVTPGGYVVTIGAAGAGAAAGNNVGGTGGDTSVVVAGATHTAGGGGGGNGEVSESIGGGTGGVGGGSLGDVGADVKFSAAGVAGWNSRSAADVGFSGAGGSTPFGAGGAPSGGSMATTGTSDLAGNAGSGYGSGGSGGFSANSSPAAAGGGGAAGLVIIDEFG